MSIVMHETAPRLVSVRSEQSHSQAIQPASSHYRTPSPSAECSRPGVENHYFSPRPYLSSPPPSASESIQAPPASFATSRLQCDGIRSESTVRKGPDYSWMEENTIWQINSTHQSNDDKIRDEKLVYKAQSPSRIVNPGPLAHSGTRVLWIEDEASEGSNSERHTLRILVILHSHLTFYFEANGRWN